MSRWEQLTWHERHLVHHALRLLADRPDVWHEEREEATSLAGEIWSEHCERVEAESALLRSMDGRS